MAGKKSRRRAPWTPCEQELRRLLKSDKGVASANRLSLPTLKAHPAIKARMPSPDRSHFEDALRSALADAIRALKCSDAERAAIKWQFDLGNDKHESDWEARLRTAIEIADSNKNRWWRDRLNKKGELVIPFSTVRILLGDIEYELNKQATGPAQPVASPPPVLPDTSTRPPNLQARPPRNIRVGCLEIQHAISIASCDKEQSSAQELLLEFEKSPRPSRAAPGEWPLLEAQLLPVLQEEARRQIAKFENDPALDFVHVEHQPSSSDGPNRYKVGVAESKYYLWAAMSNSLDRKLTDFPDITQHLGYPTLREGWNCDPSTLADLTRLPAPAYIGVCVVVIAEGKIVVLKRQSEHFVAVTGAHFVGEGMEPKDRDASGRFSPESAAWRGCREELGVGPGDFHSFIPTGLIIDTKRWQPLFTFVAECKLTIPKLKNCMRNAKDKYETKHGEITACVPWTIDDEGTLALLTGSQATLSLASNHAQAALLHALYYSDGREAVDDRLEQVPSPTAA